VTRKAALVVVFAVLAAGVAVQVWMAKRTIVIERPMLGAPPPTIPDLRGQRMPAFDGAESLRGRIVVVSVWATWCNPCRSELPRIEKEILEPHRNDVAVVAFARGETAERVREFNRSANLTMKLIPDPHKEITDRFGGYGPIPRTFVVNRDGVIVYQGLGYSEERFKALEDAVERELRATTTTPPRTAASR
jgi:peroxiredoxin